MLAVVLAGGLGTRMRPHTEVVPKVLLDVAGRPFVDWQLEKLASCGFSRVLLCVAHLGDLVRMHVGDGTQFGVRVAYADEGPHLLGTAGAVRAALSQLDETFVLTYGDSYLPFDYAAPLAMLRDHSDCDGVMSVYCNQGKWDSSNVRLSPDRAWVAAYEKGATDERFDHIDYGCLALRRTVFDGLAEGAVAGLDALQTQMAAGGRLRAIVAQERFCEIGSPAGLRELSARMRYHPRPLQTHRKGNES
jgi:NDP-sugar pyrophosphorylase family protein